jgi:MFS family permease
MKESSTADLSHVNGQENKDAEALGSAATAPYSIFSLPRKRWIVFLVAMAGWFSTLSSFVYFPAITALSESLNVSISKIDITVTSYLVVSAIAPAISGDLADVSGRRPVFIVMLLVYVTANIGLALQHSYVALLLLRMLQSAGISGE